MFVLRRVLNDVYVSNIIIGETYSVYFKNEHSNDFNQIVKTKKIDDLVDKIFAFVVNKNGEEYPLYVNSRYYMMTSDGSTFEKIKER